MKTFRLSLSFLLLFLGIMTGACGTLQLNVEGGQMDSSTQVPTPTTEAPQVTPQEAPQTTETEMFSSDSLGICFSYPQGYTQMPYNETVEIAAPGPIPGTDDLALFWLEMGFSQNRTAQEAADQEANDVAGLNPGRWAVELGGEQALVLDGMPGQDLVRRVYIVREDTLFILTFSPTRSENAAANDQMEALYDAVTSSWAWSACLEGE